ncbi:unnamed protein product [Euphydryas editha]|uniref:Uncharacterized protein n=1 Tax=Euphydryas editha TaxID=104508 RepID=A0AAU9UUE4_EUPED|nr:unnamed protein product [Euphydryas editha]
MSYLLTALSVLCGAIALGSISIRRAGWLDRVVAYHKNKFFEELKSLPIVQIKATIERAPPGYKDSQDWDFESVDRLLTLIRDSDGAKDVRQALRRSLGSSRRFMSIAQSFKAFPSLMKDHPNELYYDIDSGEYYADVSSNTTSKCTDDDIIIVSNPVEARLPSASISVGLLKSILENRAKAGRYMPTTKKIIPWSPISRDTTKATEATKASEQDKQLLKKKKKKKNKKLLKQLAEEIPKNSRSSSGNGTVSSPPSNYTSSPPGNNSTPFANNTG